MKSQLNFVDIKVGMSSEYVKCITNADVIGFSEITGDTNPVHLNDEFARSTFFKKRIAHGMLAGSLFSTIFGSKFPGNGCIYLAQSLTFKKPIFLNDVVKATVSVSSIDRDKRRLIFDTICEVGETLVVSGNATIWVPED